MVYILLFLSVFLGVFLAQFTQVKKHFDLFLTFSSSYLLGVVFYDLFPKIYLNDVEFNPIKGFFILFGVFIQVLLTSITQGIEHGHLHKSHDESSQKKGIYPYGMFLGLFFHEFLEGIPIMSDDYKLLRGMIVHKIPIAIILYLFLNKSLKSKKKVFFYILLFALSTPLGSWLGQEFIPKELGDYTLAFVSGVLIHIATHILFERSDGRHRVKLSSLIVFLIGALLSYLFT